MNKISKIKRFFKKNSKVINKTIVIISILIEIITNLKTIFLN